MSYDEDKDRDTGPAAQRSGAVPTAKRPIAAKTPTAPPEPARVIAQESRQPRYATVTRSPKEASVRPIPSNVTVVAASVPVGTSPPLPRVHDQVAKTKKHSRHPKSGSAHHPGRHEHDPSATAASAGGAVTSSSLAKLAEAYALQRGKTWKSPLFQLLYFAAQISIKVNVTGPQVTVSNGRVAVTWEDQPLFGVSLNGFGAHAVQLAEVLHTAAGEVTKPLTVTQNVGAGTVSVSGSPGQVAVTVSYDGIDNIISVKGVQIVISTTGTAHLPGHTPWSNKPVTLDVTTTLTPTVTGGGQRRPGRKKVPVPIPAPVTDHAPIYYGGVPIFDPGPFNVLPGLTDDATALLNHGLALALVGAGIAVKGSEALANFFEGLFGSDPIGGLP
jgi:hypothetical protein